jgi:hypothetical protein
MAEPHFAEIETQFRLALEECEELYLSAARECCQRHPALLAGTPPQDFLERMSDLHKGLLIKIFASVAQADMRWSAEEAQFAAILLEHLWHEPLTGDRLREATQHICEQGHRLKWYSLVRPFDQMPPLRERVGELETVVLRVANLAAKCDGVVSEGEAALLRTIENEIAFHLRPLALGDDEPEDGGQRAAAQAVEQIRETTPQLKSESKPKRPASVRPTVGSKPPEQLADVLRELHELVGMDGVKREVLTLTNYLQLQQQRRAAGLPDTSLSLHMVFTGNPGTGKTSVARILARVFSAMGILKSGHLVETDRSGLVAEYAGQTGPKTNKRIDEALDGVLFIDEAYGLVAEGNEDPYGREAVQTLLKRMEDDRERLVVILAGYPEPMEALLHSNPGLSSRFSTNLTFADYQPVELGRIFQLLCDKNHYQLPGAARGKLLLGLGWLYDHRDEHFGNGRLVRNVFEQAIRRLANRIAGIVPVTKELLTLLDAADIELPDVPAAVLICAADSRQRFLVACPGCGGKSRIPASYLGLLVKCKSCSHRFTAEWGEPVDLAEE